MNRKAESHTALFLFVIIIGFMAAIIRWFPVAYIWATYEDLVGEWAQFYFFAITLFFSARLVLSKSRHCFFFAALAVACLYVCGEEISWGQRLFNIGTPDFFSRHNLQQEINLHNFVTGPYSTKLKRVIEVVLACGFILYGILYPLELRTASRWAILLNNKGLAAPPLYLWPFFLVASLLELRLFTFNEAEIAEILLSLALALMGLYHWQCHKQKNKDQSISPWRQSIAILLLFCVGMGLATATTVISYQVPHLRADMDNKIEGGLKKFAERYGRYGDWHNATKLYLMLHEKNQKNTAALRSLAVCYQKINKEQKSKELISKAIHLDMTRYGRNPGRVSVNLSLYKTLLQAGYPEKAEFHLQKALQAAKRKTQLEPYSASAAYWLARSHLAAGDMTSALQEMEKAVHLKPDSASYKKAFYRLTLKQKYGAEEEKNETEG